MPNESAAGGTPATPQTGDDGTSKLDTPADDASQRDAASQSSSDARDRRDDGASELRKALEREREQRKQSEREAKRLQDEIAQRDDVGKSESERARAQLDRERQRADTAEARIAVMEREALAREIAAEAGIPTWWDRLRGDNARELRADAARVREQLGVGRGALDGGVRGLGGSNEPTSMDDLIRAGAKRRS
jgi:hypothetical protein